MRHLKIVLLTILTAFFFNELIQAQPTFMSANFIETETGLSTICHETYDENDDGNYTESLTFSVGENPDRKKAIVDSWGRFRLGTADVCLRDYPDSIYLAVEGAAFKSNTAFWTYGSDKRLKKNVQTLKNSTQKFLDINFYSYKYKAGGGVKYGILAQEMKNDFPHSVGSFWENGVEYHTFNPNNLFFMGMKVIQENSKELIEQAEQIHTLEAENQDLRNQLAAQQKEIEAIKAMLTKLTMSETESESTNTSIRIQTEGNYPRLEQNIPNPFSQFTTIPYYLPDNTQTATLLISDMTGKRIAKHILPTQKGAGKIEVDIKDTQQQGGTFTYSLYINETLIDTKKMVLVSK